MYIITANGREITTEETAKDAAKAVLIITNILEIAIHDIIEDRPEEFQASLEEMKPGRFCFFGQVFVEKAAE